MKIGDEVICIKRGKWVTVFQGKIDIPTDPVYGETYIINHTAEKYGELYIVVDGFNCFYNGNKFRNADPFQSTKASRKLANDAMKEVKEYIPIEIENPVTIEC